MTPSSTIGQGTAMDWARILAHVTGTVDQELLSRNEYLAVENRILKAQLKGRLKLSDVEAQIVPARGRSLPHRCAESVRCQVLSLRHYRPRQLSPGPVEVSETPSVCGLFAESSRLRTPAKPPFSSLSGPFSPKLPTW